MGEGGWGEGTLNPGRICSPGPQILHPKSCTLNPLLKPSTWGYRVVDGLVDALSEFLEGRGSA